jgi:hypothetical protein
MPLNKSTIVYIWSHITSLPIDRKHHMCILRIVAMTSYSLHDIKRDNKAEMNLIIVKADEHEQPYL